ncbi:transmembrane protein [Thraustotheca clavata]|uniref:Ribosome biogenesis protein NOP53 n=1 Tax=Thraustotheca clavata TaxID=74557 RepID=A0A1W0AB99_9STRA|nr:transmembrane protein [Thraustotheca clavata]
MMVRKRKLQRIQEVGAEVEAVIEEKGEATKLQSYGDEHLFAIDTKGSKKAKKEKDPSVWSSKVVPKKAKAIENKVKQLSSNLVSKKPKKSNKMENVWGDDGNAITTTAKEEALDEFVKPAVIKKKAALVRPPSTKYKVKPVEVAAAGQSYHPEFESHQDVLAEAVAKKHEKKAIREANNAPLGKGLTEETKQYINNAASDEEDEEEAVDDEADNDEESTQKTKVQEKLTRSDRNRQARHKNLMKEIENRKANKKLLKQINTVNSITGELNKKEKLARKKKEIKKFLLEKKLEEEPEVLIGGKKQKLNRDTVVSLTEELSGNMRTLKPKGSVMQDRFDSLLQRNMIEIGKPKKHKKKQTKFIPKHNYKLFVYFNCSTLSFKMADSPRRSFKHGPSRRIVEVNYEEYHYNKNFILTKLRNRFLWISVLAILFGTIELVLYCIIRYAFVATNVLYRQPCIGIPLMSIYMIYWAACSVVCAHGFYMYFGWKKILECGTNAVMHSRFFEILGVGWTIIALYLLISKFSVFGFLDISVLGANAENIEYTVATSTLSLHLIFCPWLLRTVHTKTTQIDDIFASEFLGKTRFKRVDVAPMVDRLDDINSLPVDVPDNQPDQENEDHQSESHSSEEIQNAENAHNIQFSLDPKHKLKKSTFWDLWKKTDVSGSFSCNFKNTKSPSLKDVTNHLTKIGFHVVSHNESKDVMEIYFYGYPNGVDITFVAEFVFVYSRQFFQTTFKCEDKDLASDFVKLFQLQELMETME